MVLLNKCKYKSNQGLDLKIDNVIIEQASFLSDFKFCMHQL
jgi:hypothetical protein